MTDNRMINRARKLQRTVHRFMPAFEAAARLGSFTLAGEEIGLTQSAVSRQIKDLEAVLGTALFIRGHKAITLSNHGAKLYRAYSFSAKHLMDSIEDITQEHSRSQVVLSTSTANAAFMLLPRVAQVRSCFDNSDIFVVTNDPQGIDPSDNIDISFVFGKPDFSGMDSMALFTDALTPVCTPKFLEEHGPLASVNELMHCELIHMEAQHSSWIGWRRWLRSFSIELPIRSSRMNFNSYYNVIQACLAGQGVALGWCRVLRDHFADGSLVAPLTDRVETVDYYHLAWPKHKARNWDVSLFSHWLKAEFGREIEEIVSGGG